jgi:hypothetical protein
MKSFVVNYIPTTCKTPSRKVRCKIFLVENGYKREVARACGYDKRHALFSCLVQNHTTATKLPTDMLQTFVEAWINNHWEVTKDERIVCKFLNHSLRISDKAFRPCLGNEQLNNETSPKKKTEKYVLDAKEIFMSKILDCPSSWSSPAYYFN